MGAKLGEKSWVIQELKPEATSLFALSASSFELQNPRTGHNFNNQIAQHATSNGMPQASDIEFKYH
jgi:hypothetical protein